MVSADVLINPGYSQVMKLNKTHFWFFVSSGSNKQIQLISFSPLQNILVDVSNGEAGGPTAGVTDPRRSRMRTLVGGKVVV
jgi:hypothetical protein